MVKIEYIRQRWRLRRDKAGSLSESGGTVGAQWTAGSSFGRESNESLLFFVFLGRRKKNEFNLNFLSF